MPELALWWQLSNHLQILAQELQCNQGCGKYGRFLWKVKPNGAGFVRSWSKCTFQHVVYSHFLQRTLTEQWHVLLSFLQFESMVLSPAAKSLYWHTLKGHPHKSKVSWLNNTLQFGAVRKKRNTEFHKPEHKNIIGFNFHLCGLQNHLGTTFFFL